MQQGLGGNPTMAEQAGLSDAPMTMMERWNAHRSLADQGYDDASIRRMLGLEELPEAPAAPAAEPMGRLGAAGVIAQSGMASALEGVGGLLEDYTGATGDWWENAAERVGPSEERQEALQERQADQGVLGMAGDAILGELAPLAAQVGTGAGVGFVAGGPIGAAVGALSAGAYGVLRMYDQGRDNIIRGKVAEKLRKEPSHVTQADIDKHGSSIELTPEDKARVAIGASTGALDAHPGSKVLKALMPQKVAQIAGKTLGRRVLAEAGKTATKEGLFEVFQELSIAALTDPVLHRELEKLPEKDILAVGQLIADTKGKELAVSFLAGFGLGGAAGTVSGAAQGYRDEAEKKLRESKVSAIVSAADTRGVDRERLLEISKDPEQQGQIAAAASEIEFHQQLLQNMEQEAAQLEPGPAKDEALQEAKAQAKKLDKVIDKLGETFDMPGFKTAQTVEAEKKAVEQERRSQSAEQLRKKGITLKNPKVTPEEVTETADKLDDLTNTRRLARAKYRKTQKQKHQKQARDAREDEIAALDEAAVTFEGRAPGELAAELRDHDKKVRADDSYNADQIRPRMDKIRRSPDPDAPRAALERARARPKDPLTPAKERRLNELAALYEERDAFASEEEHDNLTGQIIAERAKGKAGFKLADEAAVRALRDVNGGESTIEGELDPAVETVEEAETSETDADKPTSETETSTTTEEAAASSADPAAATGLQSPDPSPDDFTTEMGRSLIEAASSFDPANPEPFIRKAMQYGMRDITPKNAADIAKQTLTNPTPIDPRRSGWDVSAGDRQMGMQDWVDETDTFGDLDRDTLIEAMREQTAADGFERSAHLTPYGDVMGAGTNSHPNMVLPPINGYGDAEVEFVHTHPHRTPISIPDLRGAVAHGQTVTAILPDQVTSARILKGTTEQDIDAVERDISAARDIIPPKTPIVQMARLRQEAALRLAEDAGLIEYTQPMTGFSQDEETQIEEIYEAARASREYRPADQPPAAADGETEGRQRQVGAGDTQTSPSAARAFDLIRAANEEPGPGVRADPDRVADLIDPIWEEHQGRQQSMSKLRIAVNSGELTKENMRRAFLYAANSAAYTGSDVSSTVLQAARVAFPDASFTAEDFTIEKMGKNKKGKEVKMRVVAPEWSDRMNATYTFLRMAGEEEGMPFELHTEWRRRNNDGMWFKVQMMSVPKALEDYLQMSPPDIATFTTPMPDPTDTSELIRKKHSNIFSDEALDRMRGSAEAMQANVYYLDHDAVAKLTPEDMISDKKLASFLLKRNEDTGEIYNFSEDPDMLEQQERFMEEQRNKGKRRLKSLQMAAAAHGDNPVGFRYRVDDKGRIYADGSFTPQTGDASKKIFRIGSPDGPSLKDMPMIDHSASGFQMATLMTLDRTAAGWFNLGPREGETTPLAYQEGYKKRDMYDQVMDDLRDQITADAAATLTPGLTGTAKKNAEKQLRNAQLIKEVIFDGDLPFGKPQIKPSVIAINYGGTKANFMQQFMKVYGDYFANIPKAEREGMWGYMATAAYDNLTSKAPKVMAFQEWAIDSLTKLVAAVETDPLNPKMDFSVGLDGRYKRAVPTMEEAQPLVSYKGQKVRQTVKVPIDEVYAAKTARSIFSQIIQGFDAAVLHRAIQLFKENGGTFVTTNHDSYTNMPGEEGRMAAAAREAMRQIFEEVGDPVGRLLREIKEQAELHGVDPEQFHDPNLFDEDGNFLNGGYNLDDLALAVPLFVENEGDIAPPYQDLQGNDIPVPTPAAGYTTPEGGVLAVKEALKKKGPNKRSKANTVRKIGRDFTVRSRYQTAPDNGTGLLTIGATYDTAHRQEAALDWLHENHPHPFSSQANFMKFANDAFGGKDVPIPPWRAMEIIKGGSDVLVEELSKLTPEQITATDEGFATARALGAAYKSGQAQPRDTAKLFLWGMLSRGVSPYQQEAAFIDLMLDERTNAMLDEAMDTGWTEDLSARWELMTKGIDTGKTEWVKDSKSGKVKEQIVYRDGLLEEGTPGRGTQHNLNALGPTFLRIMSELDPDGHETSNGRPMRKLEVMHEMIATGAPSKDIRRYFQRVGKGAGVDNKVVSFNLLVAGRDDVMVLDRIQFRNMFDDGRYGDINIYDDISKKKFVGISKLGEGHQGLLYYEALERTLLPLVKEAYAKLGRPNDASIGRYHWESWVAASNQEVGHATVDAILNEATGRANPYEGTYVRQGKYSLYDYGFRYTVVDGKSEVLAETRDGEYYAIPKEDMANEKSPFRKAMKRLQGQAKRNAGSRWEMEPWPSQLKPEQRGAYDEAIQNYGSLVAGLRERGSDATGQPYVDPGAGEGGAGATQGPTPAEGIGLSLGLDVQADSALGQQGVKTLTPDMARAMIEEAASLSGVTIASTKFDAGGWFNPDTQQIEMEPTSVTEVDGTPEQVQHYAAALGKAAGQYSILTVNEAPDAEINAQIVRVTADGNPQAIFEMAREVAPDVFTGVAPQEGGATFVVMDTEEDVLMDALRKLGDRLDETGQWSIDAHPGQADFIEGGTTGEGYDNLAPEAVRETFDRDVGRIAQAAVTQPAAAAGINVPPGMASLPKASDAFEKSIDAAKNPLKTARTMMNRLEDNFFNAMAPVRRLEVAVYKKLKMGMESAYKLAETAVNDSGRQEALMYYGAAKMGKHGEYTVAAGTKGLRPIFDMVASKAPKGDKGQHMADWMGYMIGRRILELRDNGFTAPFPMTDAEAKTYADMDIANPEFRQAAAEWKKFNDANIDFLVDAGRINTAQADAMKGLGSYVPFYRSDENVDGSHDLDLSAILGGGGGKTASGRLLSRDPGIKALKGGDKKAIDNIMLNMIRNSETMIAAGMRNHASNQIFDLMEVAGLAKTVKGKPSKKPEKNAIAVWRKGEKRWIVPEKGVTEEEIAPLLVSMASLSPLQLGKIGKLLAGVGSIFRQGIVNSPAFHLRNGIRGGVATGLLTSGSNLTWYNNTYTGFRDAYGTGPATQAFKALSGMGDYRFGGNDIGFGKDDILVDYGLVEGGGGYRMRQALNKVEHFGTAVELADRIAAFNTMQEKGVRADEAAYQARAIMDYARRGSLPWLRAGLPMIPFLNARLQGLIRLFEGAVGRDGAKANRLKAMKQLALNGLVLGSLTGLLWLRNASDEERREKYKAEPLWKRLNYHIWYTPGGRTFLIPKAFELGHIFSSVPELFADAMFNDMNEIGPGVVKIVADTVFFNAIPAAFLPAIEAMTDYSFFTGRPIDSRREDRLVARDRIESASTLAQFVGQKMGISDATGISPNMIDHFMRGYGGIYYGMSASLLDVIATETGLAPAPVGGAFGDIPAVSSPINKMFGSMLKMSDNDTGKYVGEFYKNKDYITQLYSSAKAAADNGRVEYARDLLTRVDDTVAAYKLVNKAGAQMGKLNAAMRDIRADKKMSGAEKRRKMMPLIQQRNRLAKQVNDVIDRLEDRSGRTFRSAA